MASYFTVACLGTSLSIGATRDHSYMREVVASLQAGKQSTVSDFNFSMDGGGSGTGGLPNYPLAAGLRPDAVLIEYSMNDCVAVSGTLADAQARTTTIINGIKAISPSTSIFLMTMNTLLGNSAPVTARSTLASHYAMYRTLAGSLNVGLIDLAPGWAGATTADLPDGLHPTIAAHRARTVPGIVAALSPLVS